MKIFFTALLSVLVFGGCSLKTGYETKPKENIYIGE